MEKDNYMKRIRIRRSNQNNIFSLTILVVLIAFNNMSKTPIIPPTIAYILLIVIFILGIVLYISTELKLKKYTID